MRYIYDHDYHIHTRLSLCSNDESQSTERILDYARQNGLERICITDHFWDKSIKNPSPWYQKQDYSYVRASLPLPQSKGIDFMFGVETDLREDLTLGICKKSFKKFDFVIIPTTHLHMKGFTIGENPSLQDRAEAWISRLESLLNMDLPFYKIGIAHLACNLIAPTQGERIAVLSLLPEDKLSELFYKASLLGVGIELNACDFMNTSLSEPSVMRIFQIARSMGCRFYLGSDAHHPNELDRAGEIFNKVIASLDLTENDKFYIKN